MKKKLLSGLLMTAMTVSMLAGCGGDAKSSAPADTGTDPEPAKEAESDAGDDAEGGSAEDESAGGEVTLKLFSNLPDRKNGQGLVEQMIIDEYMEENSNVKIEVEALDEEAYKTKFKAYAMDGMPDVVSIWG